MTRFKVSIIGLGRICCHYLKILNSKEFNNVNITSVCDIKKNKLVKFTRKYKHALTFNNLNDLFKFDNPDLLIIATPSGNHYENAKLALNKGCNVLIEKPITLKSKQAEHLYDLARLNKSSEVAVTSDDVMYENIQESMKEIEGHMIAELGREKIDSSIETSRSMWEKFKNDEEAEEEAELIAAFEREWGESMNKYIKNLIKDISDLNIQKTLYKVSYLLSQADDDDGVLNRVVVHEMNNIFSDDIGSGTVDEHSIQEQSALGLIEEVFDFDEDTSYVLHNKLSSGEYRGL